jgi:hypothetical protein
MTMKAKKPNLDDMLDLAGRQAQVVLIQYKMPHLVPSWLLIQADGSTEIIGTPWNDDDEKHNFVVLMKLKMRELGTVAYSLVAEAWQASAPKHWDTKSDLPDKLRPRNRPDRKEVVMALAATATEARYRQWEIKRDWVENITSLELEPEPSSTTSESWMADLLKP